MKVIEYERSLVAKCNRYNLCVNTYFYAAVLRLEKTICDIFLFMVIVETYNTYKYRLNVF